MPRRIDRINGLLRQEISQVLTRQVKDPRLAGVITITEVQTSGDLRNALVLISVMGDEETKRNALEGIQSAATFLRRELRDRLAMRYTPFFRFALDDSMEYGDRVLQVMNRIPDNEMEEPAEEGRLDLPIENGHRDNGRYRQNPRRTRYAQE